MPEEEEDDDKKAKGGKKDDKKADKVGGKDKGGAKDKGGKDKGSKEKNGGKSGSGGKGSKSGSTEGSAVGKDKDDKDKDEADKHEPPKEKKPEGETKPHKGDEQKADKGDEKKPDDAKKEPGGRPKPGEPELAAKKSASATGSGSKEKVKKHDASEKTEKSSDKSSIKSATSVEKTVASKTESTEKSSASAASEAENVLQKTTKTSSTKTFKGGTESSSRTVVRTVMARGPVYAETYYDEDTDDDGSPNYIDIQVIGRRHSSDHVDQATSSGMWNQNQCWNQALYDLPSEQPQQTVYEPPITRRTAVITGYGSDIPGSCRDQYEDCDDLTVSVWQPPPPQQTQVNFSPQLAASREIKATTPLDVGRSMLIAQKVKGMQQTLLRPLPDDVVTSTERVVYEVTRGRSSNSTMESIGGPTSRVSSGGLVHGCQGVGQFCNPPSPVCQASFLQEMRQSSATHLQNLGSGGQLRATSDQGMMCSMALPRERSAHSFRTVVNQAGPPAPLASAPPESMDIINQQANIINHQANIINQQSSIIDQQLNMMNALKSRSARCQQQQDIQQRYQVIQQEFAVPALPAVPNTHTDDVYDDEIFLSAEVVETNRVPRNCWNHRQ